MEVHETLNVWCEDINDYVSIYCKAVCVIDWTKREAVIADYVGVLARKDWERMDDAGMSEMDIFDFEMDQAQYMSERVKQQLDAEYDFVHRPE